jgi:hypothetical protein
MADLTHWTPDGGHGLIFKVKPQDCLYREHFFRFRF